MYFAPPLDYDALMKNPLWQSHHDWCHQRLFGEANDGDFTEPITAGAFISIAAWASEQRDTDLTPYWRTSKIRARSIQNFLAVSKLRLKA